MWVKLVSYGWFFETFCNADFTLRKALAWFFQTVLISKDQVPNASQTGIK